VGGPRAALSLPVGAERPRKAVEEGFAVPGSQFTYAIGTLVLWSQDPALVQGEQT
jgi:molybdate transport system substrate-binding protein